MHLRYVLIMIGLLLPFPQVTHANAPTEPTPLFWISKEKPLSSHFRNKLEIKGYRVISISNPTAVKFPTRSLFLQSTFNTSALPASCSVSLELWQAPFGALDLLMKRIGLGKEPKKDGFFKKNFKRMRSVRTNSHSVPQDLPISCILALEDAIQKFPDFVSGPDDQSWDVIEAYVEAADSSSADTEDQTSNILDAYLKIDDTSANSSITDESIFSTFEALYLSDGSDADPSEADSSDPAWYASRRTSWSSLYSDLGV